jgi:hypothetical protein
MAPRIRQARDTPTPVDYTATRIQDRPATVVVLVDRSVETMSGKDRANSPIANYQSPSLTSLAWRGIMRRTLLAAFAVPFTVAVVIGLAGTASATVTFDPSTGTGFVGKGDVQLALGWNNPQLQANAAGVTFSYNATDTYAAVCTFVTGAGTRGEQTHNVSVPRHATINSAIQYDARTHRQIDGFNLTGFGTTTTEGPSRWSATRM